MFFSKNLINFYLLWSTQSLSSLGSAMTSFALVVWSYQQNGSALTTALLSVSAYLPYVLMSLFAGAVSEQWDKKKTMLIADALAAAGTICILLLYITHRLEIWHIYLVNSINGFMNTVQRPAADVAVTLLVPENRWQHAAALRSFSDSVQNILSPVCAMALYTFGGLEAVICFDLATFATAFAVLLFMIHLPLQPAQNRTESVLRAVQDALQFLSRNRGVFHIILFLAAINFIASIYHAALPALMLSRFDEVSLGIINSTAGIAMIAGSVTACILPPPKNRVTVIFFTLFLAMGSENFFLAFGKSLPILCAGAFLGWIGIPVMNTNLDVILRKNIPVQMQTRVYAARNMFQFFTIPLGYFAGGFAVDVIFEPFAARFLPGSFVATLFGTGKGSGVALLFFIIGVLGGITCLLFSRDREIRKLS